MPNKLSFEHLAPQPLPRDPVVRDTILRARDQWMIDRAKIWAEEAARSALENLPATEPDPNEVSVFLESYIIARSPGYREVDPDRLARRLAIAEVMTARTGWAAGGEALFNGNLMVGYRSRPAKLTAGDWRQLRTLETAFSVEARRSETILGTSEWKILVSIPAEGIAAIQRILAAVAASGQRVPE